MNWIKRIWRGEAGLGFTYWMVGIVGGFAASAPIGFLRGLFGNDLPDELGVYVVMLAAGAFCLFWYVLSCVGIWRAANQYQGRPAWKTLAKAAVAVPGLLLVLGVALAIVIPAAHRQNEAKVERTEQQWGTSARVVESTASAPATKSAEELFLERLAVRVPDFREVNVDQGFLDWLGETDPISSLPRQAALDDAASQWDVDRVARVFETFKALKVSAIDRSTEQAVSGHPARVIEPVTSSRSGVGGNVQNKQTPASESNGGTKSSNPFRCIFRFDESSRIEELLPAADESRDDCSPEAQYYLGRLYYTGNGVAQDYVQAASWFRKAAEQGDAVAQYVLGLMYELGQGVPQNYAQAVIWYRKAALQGDANAQNNLGLSYYYGKGVTESPSAGSAAENAYFWLSLAAAQNVKGAIVSRDMAAKRLTQAQIAKVQARTAAWKPTGSLGQ